MNVDVNVGVDVARQYRGPYTTWIMLIMFGSVVNRRWLTESHRSIGWLDEYNRPLIA